MFCYNCLQMSRKQNTAKEIHDKIVEETHLSPTINFTVIKQQNELRACLKLRKGLMRHFDDRRSLTDLKPFYATEMSPFDGMTVRSYALLLIC